MKNISKNVWTVGNAEIRKTAIEYAVCVGGYPNDWKHFKTLEQCIDYAKSRKWFIK